MFKFLEPFSVLYPKSTIFPLPAMICDLADAELPAGTFDRPEVPSGQDGRMNLKRFLN